MKLYGFWRSLATYRVRVAMSLKKVKAEEVSIDLLHAECPRDIAKNSDPGDPEVARKSGAKHIHDVMSSLPSLLPIRKMVRLRRGPRSSEP